MKFSPLLERITTARTEAELRVNFMDVAGQWVGAKSWGLDLLDHHCQVVASDWLGLPDRFQADYQTFGSSVDSISRLMIEQHIPAHNLSIYTPQHWKQSQLYQSLFRKYGIEHGMVGPLIGNGHLIGGIYFMRDHHLPPFCDHDLIYLSTLCQYLSVRLITLRLPSLVANTDTSCLTERELEIAELVAQGLSNREIGNRLTISREGVKQALKRMFRKLNVSARAEMVAKLRCNR